MPPSISPLVRDEIERAEPEEDADTERHQADGDVVRQDLTDSTEEGMTLSRPSVHSLPLSTPLMASSLAEQRDQFGMRGDQPPARAGAECEQQRHPNDRAGAARARRRGISSRNKVSRRARQSCGLR